MSTDLSNSLAEVVGSTFDYTGLTAEGVDELHQAAGRIRERQRRAVEQIIEIGRDLILAKKLVRGRFGSWLQAEFGMSDRSAQRFMQTATAFAGKSDTVSDLPPTCLYKLAAKSTPVAVREDIITRLTAGEPVSVESINEIVDEARDREREAKAEAKLTERQRKRLAQRKVDRQRAGQEREARHRKDEEDAEAVASTLFRSVPDRELLLVIVDALESLNAGQIGSALRKMAEASS